MHQPWKEKDEVRVKKASTQIGGINGGANKIFASAGFSEDAEYYVLKQTPNIQLLKSIVQDVGNEISSIQKQQQRNWTKSYSKPTTDKPPNEPNKKH